MCVKYENLLQYCARCGIWSTYYQFIIGQSMIKDKEGQACKAIISQKEYNLTHTSGQAP